MLCKTKIYRLLLVVFFFLLVFPLSAQVTHHFPVWISLGYSTLNTDAERLESQSGIGGSVGVGYELHLRNFIFHTGAEFNYNKTSLQMVDFVEHQNLTDSEGDDFIGNFMFSESKESYGVGNVIIPVMLGYDFGKTYVLVGAKFALNLMMESDLNTTVTATASYPQFIDEFGNMPDHLLSTFDKAASYSPSLENNVIASIEFGFNFETEKKQRRRLAFFFDYGLTDRLHQNLNEPSLINTESEGYYDPVLNSFVLSSEIYNASLSTIYTGIKYTFMFGGKSKPCDCYNPRRIPREYSKYKKRRRR